ncbi:MAG: glycosyl hydrolase family 28-related protein [Bacilli bacterium]|jgi:hypothetical protein
MVELTKIGLDRLNWSQSIDGIKFSGTVPEVTAGTLYSNSGTLKFDGSKVIENFNIVNLIDYGTVGDGVEDDTDAILAAIAAMPTNGGILHVPPGLYRHTSQINFNKRGKIIGASRYEVTDPAEHGPCCFIKDGDFVGWRISMNSSVVEGIDFSGASGNDGDGVQITGHGVTLRNVSSNLHGGVGIRVGHDSEKYNCNCWQFHDVVSRGNGGHGFLFDDVIGDLAPDVNGGNCQGLWASYNGGDGLKVAHAQVNNFHGVCVEGNTGAGIRVAAGAAYNAFWSPHSEMNTGDEFVFEATTVNNMIIGPINYVPVDNGYNTALVSGGGSRQKLMSSKAFIVGGTEIRRGLDPVIGIEGPAPGMYWWSTAADADNRLWNMVITENSMLWQACADDENPATTILNVTRSGSTVLNFKVATALGIPDGMSAPAEVEGYALIYVDVADGDLKVKFADGTVKVLAADT